MDDDTNIFKILKWVSVAALVAVPLYFVVKHISEKEETITDYDDENIFASELE
jgi:hypothetical protein